MKVTLVVLFLVGLTIYFKCAALQSLPPSPLIAHAASLEESLKTQKSNYEAKDNEAQQKRLAHENEEESEMRALAADLYTNFKNLWHNDLSLILQKREQRYTFDDDIDNDVAAMQQTMATIKKNNQIQSSLQPHDNKNDNAGHKRNNHNNDNKNKNNISKSSATSFLPLSQSSAVTNLNIKPKLQFPSQKVYNYDDSTELLSSSPEMIDDILVLPPNQMQVPLHLKRRELENMPLALAAAATEDSPFFNRFLKSTKYWSRQCPLENENNCLQEYYGALIADRNNAFLKQLQHKQNYPLTATENTNSVNDNNNKYNDDDIVLLLTADQNLMQFLKWALSELYPYEKFSNEDENGTNLYRPEVYTWRKLNLSGRLEPPILVQEPRYLLSRREYDPSEDDIDDKRGLNYGEDPFIPPRGRKHNLPDIDSLLQRYETFVPNRGRRDKIRDIFKYDDLFYPNRGKRQITTAATDSGDTAERSDNTDIENIKENQHFYDNEENAERHEMQHPLLSNELMKRKLHHQPKLQRNEKLANSFDEMSNRNEPTTRMSSTYQQSLASTSASLLKKRLKSMINILYNRKKPQQHLPNQYNARRQWWKRYTAAKISLTKPTIANENPIPAIRSPTIVTNRLQTTLRSMSPLQQQPIQLYQQDQQQAGFSPSHIRPDNNKFMWLQLPKSMKSLALHFDPLSKHKLQLLLQQQLKQQPYHQPLLTMRHPRLTALQHLPTLQQQKQPQLLQLATPRETQLKSSYDQYDNSINNDLDNVNNKDLDYN